MKDRYTDNHYTITWIISHESVNESEGNVDKEDDTGYHPIYLGYLSVDPESNRLSSIYLSNLSADQERNRLSSKLPG